jgi:hypothetical protein
MVSTNKTTFYVLPYFSTSTTQRLDFSTRIPKRKLPLHLPTTTGNMSTRIPPQSLLLTPNPQTPVPILTTLLLHGGRITQNPHDLLTFDPSRPILRFTFPSAASQASFHRAFALLRSEAEKTAFMQRWFECYDGVVEVPHVQERWDTKGDEALAQKLQEEAPPPPTHDDEIVARALQESYSRLVTVNDEEMARGMQERYASVTQNDAHVARGLQSRYNVPVPSTHADEAFARSLQARYPLPTYADEVLARRLHDDLNNTAQPSRTGGGGGEVPYDDFARLTLAEQRGRAGLGARDPRRG